MTTSAIFRELSLGFEFLSHGIWPLIGALGTQNPGLRTFGLGTPVVPFSLLFCSLLNRNIRKKGSYPYSLGVTGEPRRVQT